MALHTTHPETHRLNTTFRAARHDMCHARDFLQHAYEELVDPPHSLKLAMERIEDLIGRFSRVTR